MKSVLGLVLIWIMVILIFVAIFITRDKWKYLFLIAFICIASYSLYLFIDPFIVQNKIEKDLHRLDLYLQEKYPSDSWNILVNGEYFNKENKRYTGDQPYFSDTVFSSVSVIFSNEIDVIYVYRVGDEIQQVSNSKSSTVDLLHNEM